MLCIFLTSAWSGGDLSSSFPSHSSPWERANCTHWTGGWVGSRAGMDVLEKRKSLASARKWMPDYPTRNLSWILCAFSIGPNTLNSGSGTRRLTIANVGVNDVTYVHFMSKHSLPLSFIGILFSYLFLNHRGGLISKPFLIQIHYKFPFFPHLKCICICHSFSPSIIVGCWALQRCCRGSKSLG